MATKVKSTKVRQRKHWVGEPGKDEFGDRLKEFREALGLSQERLAQAAGIPTSSYVKVEQGKAWPTWPTVLKIAKALNVDVNHFTDWRPAKRK